MVEREREREEVVADPLCGRGRQQVRGRKPVVEPIS